MSDVKVLDNGELMVAGVTAETEGGVEFVDAWFSPRKGAQLTAVDSGRLVIESRDVDQFVADARAKGIDVEVEKQ